MRAAGLLPLCAALLLPAPARAQEKPLLLAAIWGSLASYGVAAWQRDHFQCRARPGYEVQVLSDRELNAFATGLSLVLGIGSGAAAGWRLVKSSPLSLMGR